MKMLIQKYIAKEFNIEDFHNPKPQNITEELWNLVKPHVWSRLNTQEKVDSELANLREKSILGSLNRVQLTYQEELTFLYKFVCAEETRKVLEDVIGLAQYDLVFDQPAVFPPIASQKAYLARSGITDVVNQLKQEPQKEKSQKSTAFGQSVLQLLDDIREQHEKL